jgi:hypothetical protein
VGIVACSAWLVLGIADYRFPRQYGIRNPIDYRRNGRFLMGKLLEADGDENTGFSSRIHKRFYRQLWDKLCLLALWITILVTGIAIYKYNPVEFMFAPQCLFYKFTGLYCPGCGTARSLHALLHGNFLQAVDFNIFTVASLPFLVYALIAETIRKFTRYRVPIVNIDARLITLLLILIVLFWILRNLRIPIFSALAP